MFYMFILSKTAILVIFRKRFLQIMVITDTSTDTSVSLVDTNDCNLFEVLEDLFTLLSLLINDNIIYEEE